MPKRILLADDSITIQKVVELTFSDGDYEVTAVNNGAKAIQKLSEMRPDIVLSDIIMPEKNGYEVCEYVKSHPDFRNLPVILLTGTFEPFDPDRADKAGCDAVVTKPFESQSLIQKVEELIEQSRAAATAAPTPSMPEPAQPFSTGVFPPANASASGGGFQPHGSEIFSAPAAQTPPPAPMPFAAPPPPPPPAFGGETRAFPPMNFGEPSQTPTASGNAPMSAPPPPAERSPWDEPADHEQKSPAMGSGFGSSAPAPAAPEPSPWDERASGGETRAFGKMSFEDMKKMAGETASPPPSAPPPPPAAEPSPWDAPDAGGATRAIPAMSFEEMQKISQATASQREASGWGQPVPSESSDDSAFSSGFGETPKAPAQTTSPSSQSSGSMWDVPGQSASPKDSIHDPMPFGGGQSPEAPLTHEPSPWDAPHEEFAGETTAFPKMSFDEMRKLAEPERANEPVHDPWTEQPPTAPSWSSAPSHPASQVSEASPSTKSDEHSSFGATGGAGGSPAAGAASGWMDSEPAAHAATSPSSGGEVSGHLSDEQIDRIARRVVELMADKAVRDIAWEVIPDLAERVVKERIRQLESE